MQCVETVLKSSCPLCKGTSLTGLLERRDVPVLLNRFYEDPLAARAAGRGRLSLAGCDRCGFVFNRAFDPGLVRYDSAYENDQSGSTVFSAHMRSMADCVLSRGSRDLAPGVIEVGCGQGRFLELLMERAGGRISSATGFDPAWRDRPLPDGIAICREPFGPSSSKKPQSGDLIVSRHVIEHIADPVAHLQDICRSLPPSWSGRLFVETPDVQWILRNETFHDFFYEHCNYFDADTLCLALDLAGFAARAVQHVATGQYLWVEAQRKDEAPAIISRPAGHLRYSIQHRQDSFIRHWTETLSRLKTDGKVALWGAGAKGVTFVDLIDRDMKWISCLIDINPGKTGRYTPIAGCPVLSVAEALGWDVRTIIIMNSNYRREIEETLAACNRPIELVDLQNHAAPASAPCH